MTNTGDTRGIAGWTPLDLDALDGMSPFELAQLWGDRTAWELAGFRSMTEELEELAVMSTLVSWLVRWSPITMHSALLAGATVEQVAAAARETADAVAQRWQCWAAGQRHLNETNQKFGMPPEEYDRVAALLAAALGLSPRAFTCRPEPS
ncbi:hypothetical protein [Fodinicola acaciae]|uniref:hypothetical protein n=1 Tax=Fodinicola acaciae TaxID=2681555 RepID=UPI0013D743C1|nr:hypothetical protein [Fodinicola acaciae]